jgi:hypothetical protein
MAERRGPSDKNLISFNSGELSPLLDSRSDVEKVGSGCRTLQNMIVDTSGEVFRRPGTKFIATAGTPVVNPTGPPGIVVTVNRQTDTQGDPLGPKSDCVKLTLTFELTYLTIIGDGCLCGYNDFVFGSPITPPRKWRRKTFSTGFVRWEISGADCLCASYEQVNIEGTNEYDAITCVKTLGATTHRRANDGDCVGASIDETGSIDSVDDVVYGNADFQLCPTTTSKLTRQFGPHVGLGCAPPAMCYACHSGPPPIYCSTYGDTIVEELSVQDRMYDAILRGIHSSVAGFMTSVGSFDGLYCYVNAIAVRFQMLIHALTVDCTYDVTVHYSQNVGGVITILTEVYTFVADTEEDTLTFDVPVNPDGTVTPTSVTLSVH